VKRTAIAVSMCLSVAPSAAFAVDWSIKSSISESVELNDNQFMRTSPAASLGSYSTITANAEARTPTSKLDLNSDATYTKYWGPGTDGLPLTEFINYGFKGRYEAIEKNTPDKEFVEATWRQQSTSLALLNELGVSAPVTGALDALTVSGGIDRSLSALDTLNLFARTTQTSYEPSSSGIPFTDTSANGTWRHRLNSIVALTASSEVELLNYSNSFNTQVTILRDKAGVDATLSPLLSFRGSAGPIYLQTERGVATGHTLPISGAATSWIGDAALTYKMLKNTTLALTASQSIGPSIVGSLFKTDSLAVNLNHTINASSTLSFSATATRQTSTTTTDFVTASAAYSYTFTREWTAQLSYRYLHRFASTGTVIFDPITGTPTVSGPGPASSNSVLLVVSRNFTVLPPGQ
jgi:hypothetical protein